ncbi:MAG: YifB family Mg chelatase-like AAA ATPase [Thermoanaerobaculum sp.]|nr:YifB family Mg chelatase-like AAA ATPase [Thermoanaerobaculum sp.]
MVVKVCSAVPRGVDALPVHVEVEAHPGLPGLVVVGLPDAAVREAKERVIAAIRQLGATLDTKAVVVNLSPAEERKEGSLLDLAIAVGVLAATGFLNTPNLRDLWLLGELSLDGQLRPVRGILPIVEAAAKRRARVLLPEENLPEAAVVRNSQVSGASHLKEVVAALRGERQLTWTSPATNPWWRPATLPELDMADVAGQDHAKRALEVAAAGGHHVLMVGPPGSGKTMLAQRLPGILPPLSETEALETTKVYSVTPLAPRPQGLLAFRPFRSPHHTISAAGLVGGGPYPRPGEVSLAHNGVLFLDELTEFRRDVLEVLRQPLESGEVVIARAAGSLRFPARFQLVAAANPCPCGFLGDPQRQCSCSPAAVARYRSRLSGPLLDRIDLHLTVHPVRFSELFAPGQGESSEAIRQRVVAARAIQGARLQGTGRTTNAQLTPEEVKRFCAPDAQGQKLLQAAMQRLGLSARAVHRVLKVARTVADLEQTSHVQAHHVAEALAYREQVLQG